MAVAGLRGTGDWGADERPKSFRESILKMNPQGSAPIFALTGKAKKRVVTDPQFYWWDESMDIVRLQVNGAVADVAQTLITVDSLDPTTSAAGRVYGTAGHLKEGDLLLVDPATDAATYDQEIVEVVSVLSDTQFTIKRGAAGTTAAAIANDRFMTLIGSVYAEGTNAPSAVSRNPLKYNNYTQIFKDSYEITGTADVTKTRTGDAWSNDKRRKMFDHARGIEFAFLFGKPSEVTGSNGKPMRTTGGLRYQIPTANTYVYSANTTYMDLIDRISPVFDFDTPAGDERIVMCGNGALNALNKMVMDDSNAYIQWGGIVKVYGINTRELILPQGRLLIKTHPLLSRHTLYTKSMWVLDFASIEYVTLPGRDTKVKDDVQDKDEDLRRGFVQTECGIALDRGGLTCAYIGNVNYTPA